MQTRLFKHTKLRITTKEEKVKSGKHTHPVNPVIVLLPMGLGSLTGLIDPDYVVYSYENKFRHGDVFRKNLSINYASAYHKALKTTCAGVLTAPIEITETEFQRLYSVNSLKLKDIINKYRASQYHHDSTLQHFMTRLERYRGHIAHSATRRSFEVMVMEQLVEKHELHSHFKVHMHRQVQIQIDGIMRKTRANGLTIIGPGTDPNFALYGTTFDNSKLAAIEAIVQIAEQREGINLIGFCGTEQAIGFIQGLHIGLARGDKSEEHLAIPEFKSLKDVALYESSREHLTNLHKLHGKGHDLSRPRENKAIGSKLTFKLQDKTEVKQHLSCEHGLALWMTKPQDESEIYATDGRFKPGFHALGENVNEVKADKVHTIMARRVKDVKVADKWNMEFSVQEVEPKNMIHLIINVDKKGMIRQILVQHHPEESRQQIMDIIKLKDEYNRTPGLTAAEFLKKLTHIVNNEVEELKFQSKSARLG